MATIKKVEEKKAPKSEEVGQVWHNVNQDTGEEYFCITIDESIKELVLSGSDKLYVNKNRNKYEGHASQWVLRMPV